MSNEQQNTSTEVRESTNIEVSTGGGANYQTTNEYVPQNNSTSSTLSYYLLKRHMKFDPISIVFSVLILVGGLIGYFTKDSTPSLIAGIVFFLLLAVSTYIEGAIKNPWPLMVTLLVLAIMMSYRYIRSGNFMPSGMVALFTFIMLARHGYLYYLKRQSV